MNLKGWCVLIITITVCSIMLTLAVGMVFHADRVTDVGREAFKLVLNSLILIVSTHVLSSNGHREEPPKDKV
jgi:hypothetical protein